MRKLLLGSAVAVALLTGCGDEKKESSAKATEATQEIKKDEQSSTNTAQTVEKISEEIKENGEKVVEAVKEVSNTTEKEVVTKIEEVKETITTIVEENKENMVIALEKVEGEITEVIADVDSGINATALYATCASCHGQKGEKPALGKSQVIAGWDKQRIIDALHGYKDGSYGGVMKNIMTGQVNTKTDAEIEALADLISKM